MQRSQKARIVRIKEAPISWRERDLLTAAERYMKGAINFSLVKFVSPCFSKIEIKDGYKIDQVWACTIAAFHLQKIAKAEDQKINADLLLPLYLKAARIYEQEAQRILGSIFPIEDHFWETFYIRQQQEKTKPLVALDALHLLTQSQQQIAYQLLTQSLKAILEGHYTAYQTRKNHFENAKRLLMDLPIAPLQDWLNQQLIN